ncbi:MAG: hypothetical protein CM1200mP10_07300 [Candidatus Neomarinimicrobiota bacterium]|nr:MAG: hypothetical protein CM1200mP10_07300 [Candidatus Neomarinimicrobiota bacterium]
MTILLIMLKILTKKLPAKLDVCFFTNSGSESNDLALRMARNYTGSNQKIVIAGPTMVPTKATIEVSPYKILWAWG